MLSDLAPGDRPRERLLAEGAQRLEPAELLALVLGTGRGSGEDALQLAHRLLREVGGLPGLGAADAEGLQRVGGVGPVKAARILAAFELVGRARGLTPAPEPQTVGDAEGDPVATLAERLRGQVPTGERAVLGVRADGAGEPVTLALGEGLGPQTRPGALLVRLLETGAGPWWVAVLRPGTGPTSREREAADRLFAAAALLGLRLEGLLVIAGRRHWAVAQEDR
jgi:DNA repair protein RadC